MRNLGASGDADAVCLQGRRQQQIGPGASRSKDSHLHLAVHHTEPRGTVNMSGT